MFYIRSVNDGVIIPNEMKEEIFKPFVRFNEKEDGKVTTGTGIGLALSRSLAELHRGNLTMLESEEANVFCLSDPFLPGFPRLCVHRHLHLLYIRSDPAGNLLWSAAV